jgi:peptidoglycan/LPS O-acetylase OafA/YrhL
LRTIPHQNRSHYPALDGLRGIAILLVVFYHNFGFINYFFFGWLGVDLFFVLSGFLITNILLKTKDSTDYLRNFYVRRILRIFPLYYFTLILFLLIVPSLNVNAPGLDYYVQNQVWLWTYFQNWLFIFHPPPSSTNILTHFWSLAVEEQFYLVWPFVLLFFKKPKGLVYLLLGLLFVVIGLRFILWEYKIENLAYFNLYTFSRIDGICIGSLLAVLRTVNPKAVNRYFTLIILALAGLNFFFYFFNKNNQFSYPYLAIAGYTTFAVLFGLLVNEGVEKEQTFINKLLSFQPLRFFGSISYSLYVFHWPLYLILAPILSKWAAGRIALLDSSIFASITVTLLSILLAWLSFIFFEKKFLLLKNRFE